MTDMTDVMQDKLGADLAVIDAQLMRFLAGLFEGGAQPILVIQALMEEAAVLTALLTNNDDPEADVIEALELWDQFSGNIRDNLPEGLRKIREAQEEHFEAIPV